MIEVPQSAIDLAKRFEVFRRVPKTDPGRAYPYICPAGFWTIGFGHLCDAQHPPITEDEAEAYLARDLSTALAATLRYCPVLPLGSYSMLPGAISLYWAMSLVAAAAWMSKRVTKSCRRISPTKRRRNSTNASRSRCAWVIPESRSLDMDC